MATLDTVSASDIKCTFLVFGYVRMHFHTHNDIDIPVDITQLCFHFYFIEKDKWNPNYISTRHAKGEINGDIVKFSDKGYIFNFMIIFGTKLVTKLTNFEEWKLKCLSKGTFMKQCRFAFGCGISPNKNGIDAFGEVNDAYMIYAGHEGDLDGLKENDIVTIRYVSNMECGELYYGVNDLPLKKAYDGIKIKDDQVYTFL